VGVVRSMESNKRASHRE